MPEPLLSPFLRGIFSTGFARLVNLSLGMFSLMLVIRHISADAYGAFVLIRVSCVFLTEVSNLGLTLVVPKYLAGITHTQKKFRLITTLLCFRLGGILVVAPLLFIARPALGLLFAFSPAALALFAYLPVMFACDSIARTLNSMLQGLFLFKRLAVINTLAAIFQFIAILTFVFALNLGAVGLIYAAIASSLLTIVLACADSNITLTRRLDLPLLKEMLFFGLPLQLQYILDFIFTRVDTLIIATFAGTTGVAYYEVARKLPDSLMFLYDSFRSVYYPFLARLHAAQARETMRALLNNSNRLLTFVSSFCAVGAVLFGREFISLCFSPAYAITYYAFVILMFGLIWSVLDNTLGYSLVAIGAPKMPLIVNLVRAILSGLLNLALTPVFGFVGAAAVAVLCNMVAVALDAYFLWRKRTHLSLTAFLKPLLIAAGCGIPFLLIHFPSLSTKLFVGGLFISTCLTMSVVTRDDWRMLLVEAKSGRDRLLHREAGSLSES